MNLFLTSSLFALAAAGANVIGGLMVTRHKWARRALRYFIALGSGFMLGTVFLEMVPESMALAPAAAPALILLGYVIVHFFEHTFASHLHFGEETHHDEMSPSVGVSAFVGMVVHTFFDGVAIGAGFQISTDFGLLIFLAVFLHKIPDGFTIASIVMSAGFTSAQAMGASVLLGVATLIGVAAVHATGNGLAYALPVATGCTLYVAATDLMPEVNREAGVKMAFVVFAGMGLFFLIRMIAHS
jgi:ZIP family zinc transporter/zinc and cadmium transporter